MQLHFEIQILQFKGNKIQYLVYSFNVTCLDDPERQKHLTLQQFCTLTLYFVVSMQPRKCFQEHIL